MPLKSRSGRSKSRSSRSKSRSRSRSRSLRGGSGDLPPNSHPEPPSSSGGQIEEEEENGLLPGGQTTLENFGKMWGGRSGRRRGKSARRGGRSGPSDGAGRSDGGGGSSKGGRRKDGGVKSRRRHAKGGFVGLVQDALVPLGLLWMQNRSKNRKGHKLMGGKRHKTRKSRGGDDIA